MGVETQRFPALNTALPPRHRSPGVIAQEIQPDICRFSVLSVHRKRRVMQVAGQRIKISRLEQILAILAAVVCLVITLIFWFNISAYQSMWPLPGLYLIEMAAISIISAFLFVRGDPHGSLITWAASGVIGAFSILGAFSIGFFYLPVALMFVVISIIRDVRSKQSIPAHLGIFLIAGIAQLALMFTAIWLRNSGAVL